MEGTVIKRLRERSFSRSFRHPSPPIFKSLLMARTHASFSRVLGEKSAKSATLSLSPSFFSAPPSPRPPRSKSRTGKMVMAPTRIKRKVPPVFLPVFDSRPLLLTLPSSLSGGCSPHLSRKFLEREIRIRLDRYRHRTPVLLLHPLTSLACPQRQLLSSSPLCPPTKILTLAMPRQLFVYRAIFFSFLSKLKIFITQGTRFRASYYTCRSLASKLKLKFESLLRFFARTGNCYDSLRVFSTKYRASSSTDIFIYATVGIFVV